MKIQLAQLNPVVGAFEENVRQILSAYQAACQQGARILLTPELSLCGYPPHDLVERPEMFDRNEAGLAELAKATQGQSCALVVGHISRNPHPHGRLARNTVSVLENGKVVFHQDKTLLPTYDVFDEARYFEPAAETRLWQCDGLPIALAICEDLWANDPALGRNLYGKNPVDAYEKQGAKLLISISASPYEWGKRERREELHGEIARRLKSPLIYVNQVNATDEILFDGGSFVLDAQGKLQGRLSIFSQASATLDLDSSSRKISWVSDSSLREDQAPQEIEVLTRGLIFGVREYFSRTGFQTAVLGLSGGIDSAVVAALAVQALGKEKVLGVAMPSQYSSSHSLADAEALARNLGIAFEVRPIKFLFSTALRELSERRGELASIAQENLQSRLRGVILMTLSNHYRALVLTTGNKSELATGYCTLYGDMAGALAPIGDLYKTRVYELARHLNSRFGSPIPESTLTKAPSAELKPGQTDQDTLPPYDLLDAMLEDYIERALPVADLEKKYGRAKGAPAPGWVRDTLKRLEINEYKRRQAAPVLKVSHKAFGIGRRLPIAKTWAE